MLLVFLLLNKVILCRKVSIVVLIIKINYKFFIIFRKCKIRLRQIREWIVRIWFFPDISIEYRKDSIFLNLWWIRLDIFKFWKINIRILCRNELILMSKKIAFYFSFKHFDLLIRNRLKIFVMLKPKIFLIFKFPQ